MIGEPKPQASSDTSDRDQYEANAGRLAEINQKNIGELSDDEFETMLAERKPLRSAQTENIGRAQEEATAENVERDAETARKAAEAKVAEDAARAEQAAAHAVKEAEDAAKATALAERIKSGNIGGEAKPAEASISEGSTEERFEAPKTEMFEKYGERMRLDSSRAADIMREMRKNDEIMNDKDREFEVRLKAEQANQSLNTKRNQLLDDAFFGATDMRRFRQEIGLRSQKSGETVSEYRDYISQISDEYYRTAMQDPVTVLNLAEAGSINGDSSVKSIDKKLRSNSAFMRKLLDVLPQNKVAESFWQYVAGEAHNDRGLYVAAVQKSHLNYQYGPKEWKTDPEIQKIALESGLYPEYLQQN